MIEEKNLKRVIFLEIFALSLVIYLINFLFPGDYGFWNLKVNPYLAASLVVSAYYGRIYGFTSLGISLAFLMVPRNYTDFDFTGYWGNLFSRNYPVMLSALALVYIIGSIHGASASIIERQRRFMRRISRDKIKLEKEIKALEAVNREFEERVLLQTDSITALYSQIDALHSQDLTKSLNSLLGTAQNFTKADKLSIWEYQQDSEALVMIANIGWIADDAVYAIENVEGGVKGWVYRNNQVFSLRMLVEHDIFSKMDTSRSILVYPINISKATWGVLSIESMSFHKYNLYTEKILSILVDLAGPAIERAVEYEALLKHADIDPYTGLPSPVQYLKTLEKEMEQLQAGNGVFSVIIMEIRDMDEIIKAHGNRKAFNLVMELVGELGRISGNRIDFFHYKGAGQFGLVYPNTDYDGAAFFCFESLGMITSRKWEIDGLEVNLEVFFGYASTGKEKVSVSELLDNAERLLEMQKV